MAAEPKMQMSLNNEEPAQPVCYQELPARVPQDQAADLLLKYLEEQRPYDPFQSPPNLFQAKQHQVC